MKKLLLLLATVGMIFTACDKGDFGDNGNPSEGGVILDPNNPLNNYKCASNEILYISKSCLPMELNNYDGWGANLTSNTYDNGVGRLKFDGNVTAIPSGAFKENDLLQYIKMPNTITEIGYESFYKCSSLTSVAIPNGVTSIGEEAFRFCSSLTSITIPNSVTSIGERAFDGCTGELKVNCNIPSASSSDYGAFYNSKFTKVTIGDSVTSIGNYAFSGCSSLTSVYYTGDLSAWCKMSFDGYSANPLNNGTKLYLNGVEVTDITIPSDITEIKDYTFFGCKTLTSVTIPDSVTSIGSCAFSYCTSLTSVTIGNSVTSIGNWAFRFCTSLTSVTIPDSVTSIGEWAFYNCWRLTSVTIGNSVTSIGNEAFSDCSSLTSVTIPDSVTSIGESAFHRCTSLTSITIPDGVTSIGYAAFAYCTSLTSVYCKPTTPPTGGYEMFSYYDSGYKPIGCKIYVPRNSVSAYKSAKYWSDYASDIEGYDF